MERTVDDVLTTAPVIPVVTVQGAQDAVRLAEALVAGGLPVVEVTLRTTNALSAIEAIAKNVPDAIVGAGTVLTPGRISAAVSAGAEFIVSPGVTDELITAFKKTKVPVLPGAATASEVMRLLNAGFVRQKFFPAEAAGGVAMLKGLAAPLADVRFCPTGGIKQDNAQDYLSLPNVVCVGGTWIAPTDAIAEGDWKGIEQRARQAADLKSAPP